MATSCLQSSSALSIPVSLSATLKAQKTSDIKANKKTKIRTSFEEREFQFKFEENPPVVDFSVIQLAQVSRVTLDVFQQLCVVLSTIKCILM